MSYGAAARPATGGAGGPPCPRPCAYATDAAAEASGITISSLRTNGSLLLLRGKAAINRFDEHVRRIRRVAREPSVVIARQLRRFDLRERHAFFHGGAHTVAHDRHHVAIVRKVGRVGHATVSGHDHRSALH